MSPPAPNASLSTRSPDPTIPRLQYASCALQVLTRYKWVPALGIVALLTPLRQLPWAEAQQTARASYGGQTSETIRLWGYDGMAPLVKKWEQGFEKDHPEVHFKTELHGPDTAMAGLYNGVADVAVMGRELWPVDTMAFRWVFQYLPFGIEVATGSLNSPGQSFSPVVLVSSENPLSQITLEQLAGIYGSEHKRGGKNLRVWGDLGLTGEWAHRPIHAYGYGVDDALGIYFRKRVLLGDYKPNVSGHLFSDRGAKVSADQRIREAVLADPLAIGYARCTPGEAGLKALPVANEGGEAAVPPSASTVLNRRYPLSRSLSFYVNRAPGKPLAPE